MKILAYLILSMLLLSIAACSDNTLKSEPADQLDLSGIIIEEDEKGGIIAEELCGGKVCKDREECKDEKCTCIEGFKLCNNKCIPNKECCTDNDCFGKDRCMNNQCVFDCSFITCESNKLCNQTSERCVCPGEFEWCDVQKACIPKTHCCGKFSCDREEYCIDTFRTVEFCITEFQSRTCNFFKLDRPKTLSVANNEFNIEVTDFDYERSVEVEVNNETFNFQNGTIINFGDTRMNLNSIKTLGGQCKEFKKDLGD